MKKIAILSVMLIAALPVSAATLADWTFEVSVPATAGPHAAELGLFAASSFANGWHANTAVIYSNPVGNGSNESFSSDKWSVGDYYQFQTATTGYQHVMVEWDQTSSNTGPRDYELQYSTNGTTFTTFGGTYAVLPNIAPNGPWSGTVYAPAFHYAVDLTTVTALDNVPAVYFRLMNNSTVAANSANPVATGGTDRVDNFVINATEIPEPASLGLLLIGSLTLLRRR